MTSSEDPENKSERLLVFRVPEAEDRLRIERDRVR
jgi:hypothetical protein